MTTQNPETKPATNGAAPPAGATQAGPPPPAALELALQQSAADGTIATFSSEHNFKAGQRIAQGLASSSLVPEAYRNNIANCLIAMELASRTGASVLMVMQNLDIVHGRPSWRSTFLIATVNSSKRFTPIRFIFQGDENSDDWGCRAYAKDRGDGEPCKGALITIRMAKAEGWHGKNGSKWKTMPEQMLMYRAASFWTRVYSPELSLGMSTSEELHDVYGGNVVEAPQNMAPGSITDLEARILKNEPAAVGTAETTQVEVIQAGEAAKRAGRGAKKPVPHDPQTGEVDPGNGYGEPPPEHT